MVRDRLKAKLDSLINMRNYPETEPFVKMIEKAMPGSRFANTLRAEWEKNKPPEKSDILVIEEMIGGFKQALESRDQGALEKIANFSRIAESLLGSCSVITSL